jgi:16S rRNA (uracil1498-N3)-methyltransferase
MSLPLIFVTTLPQTGPLILDFDAEHHLRVRRQLQQGMTIIMSDGQWYTQAQLELTKKQTWAHYDGLLPAPEKPSHIHAYLSIIKPEPLAWGVQKITEMGVSSIQLLLAERSQHSYWTRKSMEHLLKVIRSACEQSGQYRPPQLFQPLRLSSIDFTRDKQWLYADCQSQSSLIGAPLAHKRPIAYMIGPEGGWTASEREFLSKNASCWSLPGPILRSETAAICCTALLLWSTKLE